MLRIKVWRMSLLAIALAFTTGCVNNIRLDGSFWEDKASRVGVAMGRLPDGYMSRSGGLVDQLISGMIESDCERFIKGYKPDVKTFVGEFNRGLANRGVQARTLESLVSVESFPEFKGTEKAFDRDIRSIASKEKIDKLLLFTVSSWGTSRVYLFGLIPMGPPKPFFNIKGQLIRLDNNELLWQTTANIENTEIIGEWDQPPTFPNLDRAIKEALRRSQTHLETKFFEGVM